MEIKNAFNYDVKSMGKQDFLKLFVAQLKYQNPLEPLKNENFIAQLAQFSSLEELINIKDEIANISKPDTNPFLYANIIGREVKYGEEDKISRVTAMSIGEKGFSFILENGSEIVLKDIKEIK